MYLEEEISGMDGLGKKYRVRDKFWLHTLLKTHHLDVNSMK